MVMQLGGAGGRVLSPLERALNAEFCLAWEPFHINPVTPAYNARVWQGPAVLKGALLTAGAAQAIMSIYDTDANPIPTTPVLATVSAAIWDGFINSSIKVKVGLWVVMSQVDAQGDIYFLPVPPS